MQSFGGTSGTITNDGSNLTGSAPGFLHEPSQNFHLATNSPCIEAGAALHPTMLPANDVLLQYANHQAGEKRRNDARPDIGAFEFSPYHAWRLNRFGSTYETSPMAADWADPDNDGVPNLTEYAFDLDPNTPSRSGLPSALVQSINGRPYLAVQFHRRLPPSELTYQVQSSTNLLTWADGSSWSDSAENPQAGATSTVLAGTNTVVRLNSPVSDLAQAFLRLRILRD